MEPSEFLQDLKIIQAQADELKNLPDLLDQYEEVLYRCRRLWSKTKLSPSALFNAGPREIGAVRRILNFMESEALDCIKPPPADRVEDGVEGELVQ